MIKKTFYSREQECSDLFYSFSRVYNAATPENHPLVFKTDEDFCAGMSILAVCAKMFPHIRIFAFQLMSNHVHFVVVGDETGIQEFFAYFKERLGKHFGGQVDLSQFQLKLFLISDLQYFRNAIVYANRNGFVVNDNVTPFSYPWGTSPYFFQPLLVRLARSSAKPIGVVQLRQLMHSRSADAYKDTMTIDGYASPLEFCDIASAEGCFRDAKHYFYLISRNIESYSNVAKSLGESIYYTDNDLFASAQKKAIEQFGSKDLQTLTASQKIELARYLHYNYNAGDNQLQRMLRIDLEVLKALF